MTTKGWRPSIPGAVLDRHSRALSRPSVDRGDNHNYRGDNHDYGVDNYDYGGGISDYGDDNHDYGGDNCDYDQKFLPWHW